MASCDLCGKPSAGQARIEGVVLTVCSSCMTLGTAIGQAPKPSVRAPSSAYGHSYNRPLPKAPAQEMILVIDFAKRLRTARQKMKLSEKDAGLKLNIRESTLLHFESGSVQPDEATARKLERFYGITLLEAVN